MLQGKQQLFRATLLGCKEEGSVKLVSNTLLAFIRLAISCKSWTYSCGHTWRKDGCIRNDL